MTHPLPSFPPLFPRGEWWRNYMAARLSGEPGSLALASANESAASNPREWLRMRIEGGTVLSLPVAGGASALKNHPSETWHIAPEGVRESRKLAATIATIYGRTPYYRFICDRLLPSSVSGGEKARKVCMEAYEAVCGVLHCGDEALLSQLRERMGGGDPTLRNVCMEARSRFDASLSILDALMKLGPDAIFALLPSF